MDGWTVSNFNTAIQGATTYDGYASEAYAGWSSVEKSSYSLTQDITLPAGSYRLVNYSFYREGQSYNTNVSTSRAYLKAGDSQVLIKTLGSITATDYSNAQGKNDKSEQNGANVFGTMMYRNTLDFTLTEEKTITVGLTGTFTEAKSWCICGGFQLLDMNKTPNAQDVTYLITNPGFEYGDMTGWTLSGDDAIGVQSNTSFDNKAGKYYAEKWQDSKNGALTDRSMSQTLTGLTEGKYRLSAYVYYGGTGAYIQAGDNKTEITANSSGKYSVTADVASDGKLTIAAGLASGTSNWVCFDRFTLEYLPDVISDDDANTIIASATALEKETMNGDVLKALQSARTTFESEKNGTNYSLLSDAITNANTSKAAYAQAKTALDNRAKLLEQTNFYKADDSFYTTPLAAYNASTMTDAEAKALEDPYGETKIGWHASKQLNPFFGAAWNFTDYSGSPYVNTWSTEGDNDGSNFKVPFYEYFANDNTALTAKTLTGTISGLTANGWYKVTADVREQLVNKQNTTATGITMQVNDGEAVEINRGKKTADSNNLFYANYTAYGQADASGNLILKFIVADGTNVHWLSFQHVKYEAVTPDVATISSSKKFATYVTKTAVDFSKTEGLQAYKAKYDATAKTITLTEVTTVPANTAVVLYGDPTNYTLYPIGYAADVSDNDLQASAGVNADGSQWCLTETEKTAGFAPVQSGVEIPSGKAYLVISNAGSAKFLAINGTATGVNAINAAADSSNAPRYNLAGQRVGKNYKGVVIVNGKKVIVK